MARRITAIGQLGFCALVAAFTLCSRAVAQVGVITTVAGNGSTGYTGDGGPAVAASLNLPDGVTVDASGNLFIADFANNVVRKVSPTGIITTYAGDPTANSLGDGGPAIAAVLTLPEGVAADNSGNLYIADSLDARIRKVSASGIITTFAGGGQTIRATGLSANSVLLTYTTGVAVDASGDVYLAESDNDDSEVLEVSAEDIITALVGTGSNGFSGDGSDGTLYGTTRKRPAAMDVNRHFSGLNATGAGKRSRLALWVAAAALAVSISVVSVRAFRARMFSQKEPVVTQLTTQVNENRVTAAAISPDGSNLAFATFGGSVLLRRMSDGFSQALTTPAGLHVDRIAWFPDGSRLLVSGSLRDADKVGDYKVGIWLMAVNGGRAENIISDGKSGVPSPDGTRIALTSADGSIIWVAPVDGSNPRQIRRGGQSSSFSSLIWSPDSKRLAYQRRDLVPDAGHQVKAHWTQLERSYQYRYESIDVETGRLAAEAKDFVMTSACALPDGRVLFLRWFSPELVRVHQLWELRTDPGTGRILAPPRQLTHSNNNTAMSSLSASNDGKQVVSVRYYQGPPNIWIADLPPADQAPRLLNVRRLTFSLAEEFPHVWTADSRRIIFESNQNGAFDLYRQSIDRRESEPLVVSRVSKVLPEMSPDGRWLLYHEISQYLSLKVMRVPIEGGTPELVLTNKDVQGEFRCGVHPSARCIIREVDNDQFVFYELHPMGGRGQELARTNWSPNVVGDWALSPDGSRVAIPNHDPHDAKLRLLALDREHTGVQEKSMTLDGLKNLNGVVWAADGRGWFVSVRTDYGGLLTFVDLHGRVVNLLETAEPTYAVPSPDGRRIAFPEWNSVTNAWLFHGL